MKHALALALVLSFVTACKKKEEAPAAAPTAASSAAAPASASAAPAPAPQPPAADPVAPPAGDGLKIGVPAFKVGDTETKTEKMAMKMHIEVKPGQKVDIDVTKDAVETLEVLAVDAAGLKTKVKLAYTSLKETESMGGKSKDKPSPTAGKTYIAWLEGGEIKVTREDGSAPSAEEIEEVADDQKHLGFADPMDLVIAGRAWKTGEKVVFTEEELAKINVPRGTSPKKEKLTAMQLTLAGVDGNAAAFEMVMGMDIMSEKGTMKVTLNGKVVVDVTSGRLLTLAGTGPVEGNMGVPVTGEITTDTQVK